MKNNTKKLISTLALSAVTSTIAINADAGELNQYGQFSPNKAKIIKVSTDGYYGSEASLLDQMIRGNGTCGIGC